MIHFRILCRAEPPVGPLIEYRDTWRPWWLPRAVWERLRGHLAVVAALLLLAACEGLAA
jgi:hypothetical protein